MSLEKRINDMLDPTFLRIEDWNWHIDYFAHFDVDQIFPKEAMKLIREANEAECLTSNSSFIRKYKKWLEDR